MKSASRFAGLVVTFAVVATACGGSSPGAIETTQPLVVTTTTTPPAVPNLNQPLPSLEPALESLCVSLATAVVEQDQQRGRSLLTALVIAVAESDVGSEDVRSATADLLQAIVAGEANSVEATEALSILANDLGVESCADAVSVFIIYALDEAGPPIDPAKVLSDLDAARRSWLANGYADADYSIVLVVESSSFFGSPSDDGVEASECGIFGLFLVLVFDGEVAEVTDQLDGCRVDIGAELFASTPFTVDEMFDFIETNAANVRVEFHFFRGYPTNLDLETAEGYFALSISEVNPGHPSHPDAVLAEAAHQESIWIDLAIDSYTLTLRRGCFCPSEITDAYTVTVAFGEPVRVERDGDILQLEQFLPLTVEDMFDVVEDAAFADGLEIFYHLQWGFPIFIDVDPATNAVDEEYLYDVIDFVEME